MSIVTRGRSFVRDCQITVTPSVLDVAAAWCAMDADEQARFFELVYVLSCDWERPLCFQLQAISTSKALTPNGRTVMREIGEYSQGESEA